MKGLHVSTPFLNQSWIFCVDKKLFTSALFEYYLDPFSASRIISLVSDPEVNKEQRDSSKADAWILEYIVAHSQQIAIDSDNFGFIRISEANAFTNRNPNGWGLSQWCPYTVAGSYIVYLEPRFFDLVCVRWAYECRIYRKRMQFKLMEMQAQGERHSPSY